MKPENIKIPINDLNLAVSAVLTQPEDSNAMIIMAHGAGAGKNHMFMESIAHLLFERKIAVLRFNFPYMDEGKKRPDTKKKTVNVIEGVIRYAASTYKHPLFAGGKSFGGRMTSWAIAQSPDLPVHGLIYWGFPLHAPGNPSDDRADHLKSIHIPMLFLQGTRDILASPDLLISLIKEIAQASLFMEEGADHSFHVLKRSGRTDNEVLTEISDKVAEWISKELQVRSR